MARLIAVLLLLLVCLAAAFACSPGPLLVGAAASATSQPRPTTTPSVPTPTRPAATATSTLRGAAPTPTPVPPTPGLTPTATPLDPPELRAVWVDAFHDGFKTPAQVDQLVAWARQANLNALFVQVRRRGDAYYLKSFEPRTEDPDLAPGFDALQYLIDRAHQGPQPLQVHAWLATLPVWHKRDVPPIDPGHVFNQHGLGADDTWLMYRDDGAAWAGTDTAGMYYLDPGNPSAARYTVDVYTNLLRNYDVDGIHLDQVRYYEGEARHWGYNPTSVARFNQRYGRDPQSQPDPNDPDWIAWRRDQVTALVRRVYLEAKAIKPRAAVTAAVVAWGTGPQGSDGWQRQAPFASVLQDWRYWLQEGIVDYVLPMDYYRESGQGGWFDTWTQWQTANPGKRGVVIGLGSYLNGIDGTLAQLGRARALGPLGVALYSYAVPARDLELATPDDRSAFASRLRELFGRPAPVPELAWQSHPLSGNLLVDVAGHEDVPVMLVDTSGAVQRSWRTDGTGLAGGVDVAPGDYSLLVSADDVDGTPVPVSILAGSTTVVRFAAGQP